MLMKGNLARDSITSKDKLSRQGGYGTVLMKGNLARDSITSKN